MALTNGETKEWAPAATRSIPVATWVWICEASQQTLVVASQKTLVATSQKVVEPMLAVNQGEIPAATSDRGPSERGPTSQQETPLKRCDQSRARTRNHRLGSPAQSPSLAAPPRRQRAALVASWHFWTLLRRPWDPFLACPRKCLYLLGTPSVGHPSESCTGYKRCTCKLRNAKPNRKTLWISGRNHNKLDMTRPCAPQIKH